MSPRVRWALGGAGLVIALGGAVLLAMVGGAYNVAATSQHIWPVHALLDFASRQSIAWRSRNIAVPSVDDAVAYGRGLTLYREHCEPCHGGPGVAPAPFALGLIPVPANLALKARELEPRQLYWTIRHGLKMTAMPAWEFRLHDADLWAVTAFVGKLRDLSPDAYRRRAAGAPGIAGAARVTAEPPTLHPDPLRGEVALQQYACTSCHQIPGVVGANNPVGPSLAGIATRRYIGGSLPNTAANMVAWLRSPTAVDPRSAMPDLYVSERDARDIAAFLATLR